MTQADIDRNEIIEQELKAYLDGAYAKYSDAKSQLEAFAKLVDAKATAREREKILRLSTKAKNIDGNCDIVLAADIRGNKA